MVKSEAQPGIGSPRSESVGIVALGAFVTAALTLFFFSFYWNRFIGIRSGTGAFGGASAMLEGIYPYRDYFTAATPLNAVKSWLVLLLFGDTLTALRGFDVLERTALGLLVYFWLVRLFRARDAAVAAIVTIIVSACDFSDGISSYNHDAVIFAVASGFAGTLILGRRLPSWAFALAAIASGLLSSLSFDTKQTIGLGATFAVPFVVTLCVLRLEGWRRSALFLGLFVAGWAAGAGLLLLWLGSMHILPEFFQQVFVKGPSAKAASPFVFVTRFVQVTLVAWWAVVPAIIALVLTIRLVLKGNASEPDPRPNREERQLGLILVCGAIALGMGAIAAYAGIRRIPFARPTIFYSLYATAILIVYYLVLWLKRGLNRRESQGCLLAAVSFASAVMLALSWPALHTMTVPALAFPIAAILRELNDWKRPLVYAGCAVLLAGATLQKINDPFDFDDFYDPPARFANTASTLPELRGMRLPESTVKMLDETARIVREHSSPTDKIFVYPEFGIFYSLNHRMYPTVSGSHNIDVINDDFARSEAHRLLASPPAVLIYSKPDEEDLRGDEKYWRNGQRSGQRDIIAAIEELTSHYTLAAVFDVPPNRTPVKVYTRSP